MTYLSGSGWIGARRSTFSPRLPPIHIARMAPIMGREELLMTLREMARLEREGDETSHSLEEAGESVRVWGGSTSVHREAEARERVERANEANRMACEERNGMERDRASPEGESAESSA